MSDSKAGRAWNDRTQPRTPRSLRKISYAAKKMALAGILCIRRGTVPCSHPTPPTPHTSRVSQSSSHPSSQGRLEPNPCSRKPLKLSKHFLKSHPGDASPAPGLITFQNLPESHPKTHLEECRGPLLVEGLDDRGGHSRVLVRLRHDARLNHVHRVADQATHAPRHRPNHLRTPTVKRLVSRDKTGANHKGADFQQASREHTGLSRFRISYHPKLTPDSKLPTATATSDSCPVGHAFLTELTNGVGVLPSVARR
jgi:hypothetical protein